LPASAPNDPALQKKLERTLQNFNALNIKTVGFRASGL